ncbi:putative hect-domain-containing protein [Golovinomyces cichoracearum]|uniref:HECT-type E3 ubiquitin transferase n=1 Tax=Golovinomyces cichoracearum TaxID=62708 RepID=A0A420H6L7_9PEZI|nr:putative hect-domain-containing protein [Golovinomyces cichoracearum]
MNLDNMKAHDDRFSNELEIYTALWNVVPFVRLPHDAPLELKESTIEIRDPRRVYAIHKTIRRHDFQLLMDRFIHQIRYGCCCKACNTITCFSCRKRLSIAPARRYNATCARALAFYMISLDDPERNLCPHQAAPRPSENFRLPKTRNPGPANDRQPHLNSENKSNDSESSPEAETPERKGQKTSTEKIQEENISAKFGIFQESITIDHRSFIQNMFETAAIKMVEWLTPRNLESIVKICGKTYIKPTENLESQKDQNFNSTRPDSNNDEVPLKFNDECSAQNYLKISPRTEFLKASSPISVTENLSNFSHRASHHDSNNIDEENILEVLNFQESVNKTPFMENGFPSGHSSCKYHNSESLNQVPILDRDLSDTRLNVKFPQSSNYSVLASKTTIGNQDMMSSENSAYGFCQAGALRVPSRMDKFELKSKDMALRPQSMDTLTIETIELMCNVLQKDGTYEKHSLFPSIIGEEFKKRSVFHEEKVLRHNTSKGDHSYPELVKQQWKSFIEQCFFDVLKKPKTLLRSFRHEQKKTFDSQTIWYLMLRMTRVSPSLVYDSLWHAAEVLFLPPPKFVGKYDWGKDPLSRHPIRSNAISDGDAAEIFCICIHALIAALPPVEDPSKIIELSKIRSLGFTMLAKHLNSPEMVALCLQYEDAFSNELAVRLARRIFMAIPIRQKYSSLGLRKIYDDEKQQPCILSKILSIMEVSNNIRSPLILEFSTSERETHEKRVPIVVLDWARAVMLKDWHGRAEVSRDGPFGGALATIAAIYKNRQSFLLDDVHFRIEYFSERLDSVNVPVEWLSFTPNERTVHLLDYPYLFDPSTLISYFRAINYSRMLLAHETAKSEFMRMNASMQEHFLINNGLTRVTLKERLSTATSEFMVMEIRRTHVLLDTFNSIWRREERELMRPLKLRLGQEEGEEGSDSGGVQQEYLRLAIAEALNPDYGTFTIDTRTRMTWFQPGSPEPLWKYELIGMIISLAVYNGLTLPVTFPKAFYKKLLGEDVTEVDQISDGWPELSNGLTSLLEWDEKNGLVEDVFARTYEFTVEQFGQPVSLEMKDDVFSLPSWPQFASLSQQYGLNPTDAPFVTCSNRKRYVKDYIRYLTDVSIRPQFAAFKDGFFTCISRRSVSLFDASILQSLIEGVQVIDINELCHVTRYIGWDGDATHHTIRDFWNVVKKYDLEKRRKLLEFVTASDRLPVGGMRSIQFTIQKNGAEDGLLPTSFTCYGILLLPEYSDKDILEKKLTMALENSKGFGFA